MTSIITQLSKTPQSFDFFQAVRLLSQHKNIRFRTQSALHFPASTINSIHFSAELVEIEVTFLGLFGPHGLLPHHYTELILQRLQVKDFSLRNFLDLFNHKMVSLFYKCWEKYHFFAEYENSPADNNLTHTLKSLIGNGTANLQDRSVILDESLLFYTGYFARSIRSAWCLESMLSDFFELTIKIKQFQGKWLALAQQDISKLSRQKSNFALNQLGKNAVLGQKIWDEQNHFRIQIGPLSYQDFQIFLPNSVHLVELATLIQRYAGNHLSFEVQLILQADDVPFCRLQSQSKIALGWSTWLKTQKSQQPVADTILQIQI